MRDPMLVTLSGPSAASHPIQSLSNQEVGLIVLAQLANAMPGLTWGELHWFVGADVESMGWSFSDNILSPIADLGRSIGGTAMDIKRSVGSDLSDSLHAAGSYVGSAVRLFTSKKVIDGLNSSYACFTASGGVKGAVVGSENDTSACKSTYSDYVDTVATNLGYNVKAKAFDFSDLPPWVLPAGLGLVVLFFMRRRHP